MCASYQKDIEKTHSRDIYIDYLTDQAKSFVGIAQWLCRGYFTVCHCLKVPPRPSSRMGNTFFPFEGESRGECGFGQLLRRIGISTLYAICTKHDFQPLSKGQDQNHASFAWCYEHASHSADLNPLAGKRLSKGGGGTIRKSVQSYEGR